MALEVQTLEAPAINQPHPTVYPHDKTLHETQGIRHNRDRALNLRIVGQEFYELRACLEKLAIHCGKNDDFCGQREAVFWWEMVSAQAREQGF
jgi:hypothetical protein